MSNNDVQKRVASLMGEAQPQAAARVLVRGNYNLVVGGDVHFHVRQHAPTHRRDCKMHEVKHLISAIGELNTEQLSKVSGFVAALRSGT